MKRQLQQWNRFRHLIAVDTIEELLAECSVQGPINEIVGHISTNLLARFIEVLVVQVCHDSSWPAIRHFGIQELR